MKNRMRFLLIIACALVLSARCRALCEQPVIIDNIEINNKNIFDLENERLSYVPYGLINILHITTREGIIRRELLFKKGDYFDKHLIEESERRLRSFSFIRVADISLSADEEGYTTAKVYTQDSWTTSPQFSMKGGGGKTAYSFGLQEKNLLGFGKDAGVFYAKDEEDKISRQIFYNDPHFLPGFWEFGGMYADRSDGSIKDFLLRRPYYELGTDWSADFNLLNTDLEKNIYEHNTKTAVLRANIRKNKAFAGRKIYSGDDYAGRLALGYVYEKAEYSRIESFGQTEVPDDYFVKAPAVKFSHLEHDYIKTKNVSSFARVEDYNMGDELELTLGYSPKSSGQTDEAALFKAEYERGFAFRGDDFLLCGFEADGMYTGSRARNLVFEGGVSYYNKYFSAQTLAANMLVKAGRNLDADRVFTLGGLNGLRGYPAREFNGSKLFLINLEDRVFLADEFLSLCGIGGLVFFDAGYVWNENQPVKAGDIKSDIGFGVRFAFTRSSEGLVLRLDFAYALEKIRDEKRFVVSFGSRQSF